MPTRTDQNDDANAIDVSYEDTTPAPEPTPPAPVASIALTRAAILEQARSLNSAAIGLAAWVESQAMSGRVRPAFIAAWRQWHGGLCAFVAQFERLPMNLAAAQATVARQGELLEQWRAGAMGEVGGVQVGSQPAAPVQAQPVTQRVTGAMNTFPWWLKAGLTVGVIYGGYRASMWFLSQWAGEPSPAPTSRA